MKDTKIRLTYAAVRIYIYKMKKVSWLSFLIIPVLSVGFLVNAVGAMAQTTIGYPYVGPAKSGTTLSAYKTASGVGEKDSDWDIVKTVDVAKWDMFEGDTATSEYTITLDKKDGANKYYVEGEVCVYNGGDRPTYGLEIYDTVQYKVGSGKFVDLASENYVNESERNIVVFNELNHTILGPKADIKCIPYKIGINKINGAVYRNTVKVTILNHSGSIGKEKGPEPKADFSFPSAPNKVVNDEVTLKDTYLEAEDTYNDDETVNYSNKFTCEDEGENPNTAEISSVDGLYKKASKMVTIECHEIEVSKTANTGYTRTWDWTIEKTAAPENLEIKMGQWLDVNYSLSLTSNYADSGHYAEGKITVYNPAPIKARIISVEDILGGEKIEGVTCPVSFPYNLASEGTLECTYTAELEDGATKTNRAKVVMRNYDRSYLLKVAAGTTKYNAYASVIFGSPTEKIDKIADLKDVLTCPTGFECTYEPDQNEWAGLVGTQTISYKVKVKNLDVECGSEVELNNTATLIERDSKAERTDGAVVIITTGDCPESGCTLTQGYWQNHADPGKKQYDVTWDELSDGPETPFFTSGKTYLEVLETPVAGDKYYILAHQYIAAELNILRGASDSTIAEEMEWAKEYFEGVSATDEEIVEWADKLDKFNNGLIGPGHCSSVQPETEMMTMMLLGGSDEPMEENEEVSDPQPAPTPEATATPSPEATPTPTAEPTVTPEVTPTPTSEPTVEPTATPSPETTPEPEMTPSPEPTPTAQPAAEVSPASESDTAE